MLNTTFDRFLRSIHRHGVWQTALRFGLRPLHRLVQFEICRVESRTDEPYPRLQAPGYVTRTVDCETFHAKLGAELAGVDYRWAFARGDLCTATLFEEEIVAYNFTSRLPTRVCDGVTFSFPSDFVYSFASLTASSHRGNQLARECWQVAREARAQAAGFDLPCVWYIALDNLESRKASAAFPNHTLRGYSGYVRVFNRCLCFRSAGCRKLGVGFRVGSAVQTVQSPD